MQFNVNNTISDSLYHHALYLLGIPVTDTTTLSLDNFTRSANIWYRNVAYWIWKIQDQWEFDDSTWTTIPIATTTLVANQQYYTLPTTALDVLRVEVMDVNGDYRLLTPIDNTMIKEATSEFFETAGMPQYYDLVGDSVVLYPKPSADSVTTVKGLKIYLQRDVNPFSTTDRTRQPGFYVSFHPVISYGAAYDFAFSNGLPDKANMLLTELGRFQNNIETHYAKRQKDFKKKINPVTKLSI